MYYKKPRRVHTLPNTVHNGRVNETSALKEYVPMMPTTTTNENASNLYFVL